MHGSATVLAVPQAFLSLTLSLIPVYVGPWQRPSSLGIPGCWVPQVDGDQLYISRATSACGKCRLCGAAAAAQVINVPSDPLSPVTQGGRLWHHPFALDWEEFCVFQTLSCNAPSPASCTRASHQWPAARVVRRDRIARVVTFV